MSKFPTILLVTPHPGHRLSRGHRWFLSRGSDRAREHQCHETERNVSQRSLLFAPLFAFKCWLRTTFVNEPNQSELFSGN